MSDTIGFLFFYLICFLICIYLVTKIWEFVEKKRKERYEDDFSEFMSDLYKIQIKWSRRGMMNYSKAVQMIINASAPVEKEPKTVYGKAVLQDLKEIEDE